MPHSRVVGEIVERLAGGLHPSPLPLGLRNYPAKSCNLLPQDPRKERRRCVRCGRPHKPGTSHCGSTTARKLITDASGRKIEAVEIERSGKTEELGALIVVSCGAVNSAALLLRSASSHPEGLANSSGLVGKRYMAQFATMMQGFHPLRKNDTVFQKTVAINDFYRRPEDALSARPDSTRPDARRDGADGGAVGAGVGLRRVGRAGVDWLAMTEDLPRLDNKVTIDRDGRIHLHYSRTTSTRTSNWCARRRRSLKLGYWIVMTHSYKTKNTTHQCGTLVFGTDPKHSVLDTYCKTQYTCQRRRRVVLPLICRGEPRPHHRRAGDPRRRSNPCDASLMSANPPAVHRAGVEEGPALDAVLLEHLAILHHELHVFGALRSSSGLPGIAMRSAKKPALIGPRVFSVSLSW